MEECSFRSPAAVGQACRQLGRRRPLPVGNKLDRILLFLGPGCLLLLPWLRPTWTPNRPCHNRGEARDHSALPGSNAAEETRRLHPCHTCQPAGDPDYCRIKTTNVKCAAETMAALRVLRHDDAARGRRGNTNLLAVATGSRFGGRAAEQACSRAIEFRLPTCKQSRIGE
ncbi:hypothetical protein MRX96_007456 [Rhipicephalus microplus]